MSDKRWIMPVAGSLFAFGVVSFGSSFETEALAAIQSWDYVEECSQGCSQEEDDEYFRNGSYLIEVMEKPGDGNREEMLELTRHSQGWCSNMLEGMAYKRNIIYSHDTSCVPLRLGW